MLNYMKKTILIGALVLAAGTAWAEYPEKPIEVIVGFSAGGGTDVMARTAAPFIEKYLGKGATLVVKNVPGASGQIGVTQVAESKADGYTLGTYNLPGMMARTLDRKTDYTADSFTYLANVVNDPNVIVTSKASGLDTLEKLIEAAKAEPLAVTVGMSSLGGDDHFMLIKLQNLTGTEFTIVPFKGSAPARTALMGGHVAMGILNVSRNMPSFRTRSTFLELPRPSDLLLHPMSRLLPNRGSISSTGRSGVRHLRGCQPMLRPNFWTLSANWKPTRNSLRPWRQQPIRSK